MSTLSVALLSFVNAEIAFAAEVFRKWQFPTIKYLSPEVKKETTVLKSVRSENCELRTCTLAFATPTLYKDIEFRCIVF